MIDKRISYHIGELAKALGLSPRAIRYYEEQGLIRPARTTGGFRTYTESDRQWLRMVLFFKDAGMSLEEIRTIIDPGEGKADPRRLRELKALLESHRKALSTRVQQFQDAIEQIDRAHDSLASCDTCGMPSAQHHCDACLENQQADAAPLIRMLFSRGETLLEEDYVELFRKGD